MTRKFESSRKANRPSPEKNANLERLHELEKLITLDNQFQADVLTDALGKS